MTCRVGEFAVVVGVVASALTLSPAAAADDLGVTSAADGACEQFNAAIDLAAVNYSDFADSISGDQWSYQDPVVAGNNEVGRIALRQSAAAVWSASATPGLAPEVSNPMKRWSGQAAKLLLLMGVRARHDTINSAAAALNEDTYLVLDACSAAVPVRSQPFPSVAFHPQPVQNLRRGTQTCSVD